MFPEPPDPNKNWIKGLFILIAVLVLYAFLKEGMRMMSERGNMNPPSEYLQKPYYMKTDGETD